MTVQSPKTAAALHEAGHAVTAHLSKFHSVVGAINLADYGAGEIYISLSERKCVAGGIAPDASSARDPRVVEDLAVVLVAGLISERVAEERDAAIHANPKCAAPDYEIARQQLCGAGLAVTFDRYESQARELLSANWGLVADLAAFLLAKASASPLEVIDFIKSHG